ncbi:oxygenase MpaB family protein [Demequina sp. SYSU T00039]|uniref:Oxygenase MpaB family protein n=1 Tax=Demequina lignilytica TaxID=3051663 RepID=A0AAW7M5W6_9MICO|nr:MULTISPECIES: oxygenase MpaB family protein [unclassified Demequina]MDN4478058.1 oxygenase MpaB family protein [Demequina sp. SYSU T00039-1]MDN4488492.1 oxygenase MpaB family protein [Demequina sp. SYSU T00039]
MRRDHWRRVNAALDPERDFVEIYRNVVMHEFPWDMNQSLSFALFRTYAVPGIGGLLDRTGEFTARPQKRYDDTALLLEVPTRAGFAAPEARSAIRRINQMHRAYDIPDHEFRYVLSTFVVVPKRWLDAYGKRALTDAELDASVRYYRELGRHMNITDLPETYEGFAELMDGYEAEHFAFDEGARRVADATLALLLTFRPYVPKRAMEAVSRALMDDALLDALGYAHPPRVVVIGSRVAVRLRGVIAGLLPARAKPTRVEDLPWIRSYPDGFRVEELGTFPGGCPVPHTPTGGGDP